ncbi:hypothetical protein MHBO_003681, partial [Bonamia ostreae]
MENLISRLKNAGAFINNLKITNRTNNDRFVQSISPLKQNEILVKIPRKLIITIENAVENETVSKYIKIKKVDPLLSTHTIFAVFILSEMKNEKWRYYLKHLPFQASTPLLLETSEMPLLIGTGAENRHKILRKVILDEYENIVDVKLLAKINLNHFLQ